MRFREWMEDRGLTRVEAATLLETTPTTITNYFWGKHRPRSDMTAQIFTLTNGEVCADDLQAAYQEARSE
tara:strand:- start:671 stop:880 length:210 start_codon:yes stop_codon:yes gene_type:complete